MFSIENKIFQEIKNKVKRIINDSKDLEISENTNNTGVGIYMIYIDSLFDDSIIPIYIGQTGGGNNRNFQKRYKEHLQEIMALNRLSYDYYKRLLLDGYYEFHYKSCKIFQYMVDHKCTLKDFHMIVLETMDEKENNIKEKLDIAEQRYFSEFLPSFFGFNQVNTITQLNSNNLIKFELEDCNNFIRFFGYGYTKFNYYHCFPKTQIIGKDDKKMICEVRDKKEFLLRHYFDENRFDKYKDITVELRSLEDRNKADLRKHQEFFENVYAPKIKEYCILNQISINQKYHEIVFELVYHKGIYVESLERYLKKKNVRTNILEEYNKDKEFVNWREKNNKLLSEKYKIEYGIQRCENAEKIDDLMRLLPQKKYDNYPLKDKYNKIKFDLIGKNELIINFEFSNHGSSNTYLYPISLVKMDYKLKIDDFEVEKKDIFIIRQNDKDNRKTEYYEKYDSKELGAKPPFCIISFSDYISTAMEIQNGINDYTLKNRKKYDFGEILDEINELINSKTVVIVMLKERMKSKCKAFIENNYKSDNLLKYKIIKAIGSSSSTKN